MFAAAVTRCSSGIAVRACGGLKKCAGGSAVGAPRLLEAAITESPSGHAAAPPSSVQQDGCPFSEVVSVIGRPSWRSRL
jgi:hypothetical protein